MSVPIRCEQCRETKEPVSWLFVKNKFNPDNPLQIYFCSDECQAQYEAGMDFSAHEIALIRSGLSPQEANIMASIEMGERPIDIAKRLGITRQAVSDATRRAKNKMSQSRQVNDNE
jgi:DNA-binding CsgD family transcriptional regulator